MFLSTIWGKIGFDAQIIGRDMSLTENDLVTILDSENETTSTSIAVFVIGKLEEFSLRLKSCPCDKCQESAQWGKASSRAIGEIHKKLYRNDLQPEERRTILAILYLASQGATAEIVRRVENARHNKMTLPDDYGPII